MPERKRKPRFYVDGWGKDWFVCSRNHKTVAKCPNKLWANLICRLLMEAENAQRAVILDRVRRCEQVMVDEVEHVRLDGYEHYLAYSLLEAITEGHD